MYTVAFRKVKTDMTGGVMPDRMTQLVESHH
jgi:hypothetical protein